MEKENPMHFLSKTLKCLYLDVYFTGKCLKTFTMSCLLSSSQWNPQQSYFRLLKVVCNTWEVIT